MIDIQITIYDMKYNVQYNIWYIHSSFWNLGPGSTWPRSCVGDWITPQVFSSIFTLELITFFPSYSYTWHTPHPHTPYTRVLLTFLSLQISRPLSPSFHKYYPSCSPTPLLPNTPPSHPSPVFFKPLSSRYLIPFHPIPNPIPLNT